MGVQSESDHELLERLVRARANPRDLAEALPEPTIQRGLLATLALFCVAMLIWALVVPFTLAGPAVGLIVNASAFVIYLAIRPLAKRVGWLSVGAFTVSRDGVLRTLAGIGQARRRILKRGDDVGFGANAGVAVVLLLIVIGAPTALVMVTNTPEIMLAWMVMAMLTLNEMVLLVLRTVFDSRRRPATNVDGQFGLALITDYLERGGDARRLTNGIPLDEFVPPNDHAFRALMRDAILRRARAHVAQEG